jgi:uncharacterized SAM-binding protein YcdF (DUF218 family)
MMEQKERPGCLFRSGCLTVGGLMGFIFLVILGLFGLELLLTALGAALIIADPLQKTDAIVVLSGGGLSRLEEAAKLFEEKNSEWVILTETGKSSTEFGLYSELDRIEAIRLGIPPNQIIITEQHVEDTGDEARVVRKLAQSRGFHSLTVVTDPFHSLRTRLIFREGFKDSDIKVYVRPVRDHWYRSTNWWLSRQGWEATLSEYVRLFYYFFKSSTSG